MAKKKPLKPKKPSQAARKANPDLCQYYEFGCEVLMEKEDKANLDYLKHFREETGRTENDIYKALMFVNLCRHKELDQEWLCKLHSKRGKRLRVCHIHRLVHVTDKGKRKTLARQAGAEGWSVQRLTDEIRKIRPEHLRKGRRPPRPQTIVDALVCVEKMVRRFSRLEDVLRDPDDGVTVSGVSLKDLPRSIKSPLKEIFTELESLQEVLDRRIREKLVSRSKEATGKRKRSRKKRR